MALSFSWLLLRCKWPPVWVLGLLPQDALSSSDHNSEIQRQYFQWPTNFQWPTKHPVYLAILENCETLHAPNGLNPFSLKPVCTHVCQVTSVVSASMHPNGLQPTKLLYPWESPGKNTGVGCHALLQGIFPTQGSIPDIPHGRMTTQLPHKIWIYDFKISFPFSKLPFHFHYGSLGIQKLLSLM